MNNHNHIYVRVSILIRYGEFVNDLVGVELLFKAAFTSKFNVVGVHAYFMNAVVWPNLGSRDDIN